MLRFAFVVCLFTMMIASCKKGNKKDCPYETFEYHFKNNAKVDTLSVPPGSASAFLAVNIGSGTKRVFSYKEVYTVCPEMTDGVSSRVVYFEIDPLVTHFIFAGDDLQAARCYYQYGNVLYSPGGYTPGGSIEGTKINEQQWKVDLNLALKNNQTLQSSAIFTVE